MAVRLITLSDARVAGIGIGASVVSDAGLLLTAVCIAGLIGGIACKLLAVCIAGLIGGIACKLTALRITGAGHCTSVLTALRITGVGRTSPAISMAGLAGLLVTGIAGVTLRPAGVGAAVLWVSCW